MELFEVAPDDNNRHQDYLIDATHKWALPGIDCPACGFKGSVLGLAYPTLCLSAEIDERPYKNSWPVSPSRFRELSRVLSPMIEVGFPLFPGTEFGPLEGKASGKLGDITWLNPWTPLILPEVLDSLRKMGISGFGSTRTVIAGGSRSPFRHLELCIDPKVELEGSAEFPRCPECGIITQGSRRAEFGDEPIRVRSATLPPRCDLIRVIDMPSMVLATYRFVAAAAELNLKDITFREVLAT